MFSASSNRALVVASAIIMRLLLDHLYYEYILVNYSYAGFDDAPDFWFNVSTWAVTVALAFMAPLEATASKTVTLMFFFFFVLPMGPVSALGGLPVEFYLYVVCFQLVLLAVVYAPAPRPLDLADVKYGREIFVIVALVGLLATVVLFVMAGGLAYVSLDVLNVYEVRWDINEILTGPLGYLTEWCKYVFAPGLLVFSIWRRKVHFILLSLGLFVLLFAITSAKAMLFYPALVFSVYAGVKFRRMALVISTVALGATSVAWLAYVMFGQNILSNQILLRVLYIPARDAFRYYDYFNITEKMYFSNTIFAAPFRTIERDNIALTIGQNTWGYGSEVYVNTGVFATSFMHLGWFGVLVFPILVGLSLRFLDKVAAGRVPPEVAIPLVIISAAQFLQSDFTTTLFSHGMLLLYGFLLLMGERVQGAGKTAAGKLAFPARAGSQPAG